MPYTGPSRGCLTCRSRKVKCDESRPTCKRCANAKRLCSGYVEESNFIFRSENESARRRAHRARAPPSPEIDKPSTINSVFETVISIRSSGHASPSGRRTFNTLLPFISPPAEQQAFYAFIKDFVLFPESPARGYMEYIPTEYEKGSKDSCLGFTVSALSLAHLARRAGDPELMAKARRGYSKALTATNASISSPLHSRDDRTLMAVLLLCFFEILLHLPKPSSRAMSGWQHHVQGAAALIRFRGPDLLKSDLGLRLFLAHRSQMIKAALESGRSAFAFNDWQLPPSAYSTTPAHTISPTTALSDIARRITDLVRITRIHTEKDPGTPPPASEAPSLMARALSIDLALQSWADTIPKFWLPTTTDFGANAPADTVWQGKVETYKDLWYASVWNEYRSARLTLLKCVVTLANMYPNLPPLPTVIMELMQDLVDGICASVPYHLGCRVMVEEESGRTVLRDYSQSMAGSAIAGLFLLWPMYAAVYRTSIDGRQRNWIVRRYAEVAERHGISGERGIREWGRVPEGEMVHQFCEQSGICRSVVMTERGGI